MVVKGLRQRLGDEPGGSLGGLRGELKKQLLVGGECFFLGEVFAVALQAGLFHGQQLRGFAVEAQKNVFDIFWRAEIESTVSCDPAVEAIVVSEDSVSRSERFDKRWVRSTDTVAVEIG